MTEFIWNGVGLTTPDEWEPSALERDGFLLELDGQPVCELKWSVIQGSFSFEKHLKRLIKEHKAVDMRGVSDDETPFAWQEAAARLIESGIVLHSFIWRTSAHKGIGAALHNPATGLAALIQFFTVSGKDETIAAETLASFRDYLGGKTVPWAMFGLRARVPAQFSLNTFSFKPGHYTIKFWRPKTIKQGSKLPAGKGPGASLIFERYAPASVLLKGKEFDQWILDSLEDPPPKAVPMISDTDGVAWAGLSKTSLLRAFFRREVRAMGRAWTTETGNAILIVSTGGVIPIPGDTFTEICESYELV